MNADDVYVEIDDSRVCAQCDRSTYGDAGHSCETCDEWICDGCWTDKYDGHRENEEHLRRAAEQGAI